MVSRRTDRLLHKITHHTNKYQPYNKYLSGDKYPKQDGLKLGRPVTLKYRNKYIPNIDHISETSPDKQQFDPTPYEDDGIFVGDIIEQEFILLRYDIEEPYRMIAISDDYIGMIVGDSRDNFDTKVYEYPKQIEEFLGLLVTNQYLETPDIQLKAVVLSCDSMEPCNAIIAEFYADINRNDYVRFVTESEVQSIVMDRYDADGLRDYNAEYPDDDGRLIYINLDGVSPLSEGQPITVDANGGPADALKDMYRTDILTREEVLELRGRILTEKRIYGCEYIYPETITIDQEQLYIVPGEGVQLTATVEPEGAIGRIFWKSSDPSVVSVNNKGLVVGKSVGGSATITAYTEFGGIEATCEVMVVIAVTDIKFEDEGKTIEIKQDESYQIVANVLPDNATVKDLNYTSSNEWVLIDENGKVTLKEGYALDEGYNSIITISSVSNPEVSVSFNLNYLPTIIHPENINLSSDFKGPYTDSITNKDFYFLAPSNNNDTPEIYKDFINYKIEPKNSTENKLYWVVTNPDGSSTNKARLVNIDNDSNGYYTDSIEGKLPGIEIDTCETLPEGKRNIYKVTATGDRGITNSTFVARGNPVVGLEWMNPGKRLKGWDKGTFRIRVDKLFPDYPCSEKRITLSSSNPDILKLDLDQVHYKDNYPNYFTVDFEVVNLRGGIVTVTATTYEDYFGEFTATMELDIKDAYVPVQSISFKRPYDVNLWTNIDGAESTILELSYVPSNATYKEAVFNKIAEEFPSILMEQIDSYTCRVTANKYNGHIAAKVKATSQDNPSATALINIFANTECKEIKVPENIEVAPFDGEQDMTIEFLSGGYGGVNREFIEEALSTAKLENNNCNLSFEVIDDGEGSWDHATIKFVSDQPGSAVFKIYDRYNTTWRETNIKVGVDISEIVLRADLVDWETYDIGDDILIPVKVTPWYWNRLPDDGLRIIYYPKGTAVLNIFPIIDPPEEYNSYIKIHMNNIIRRNDRIEIGSIKSAISDAYVFPKQVGVVKVERVDAYITGDRGHNNFISTYHEGYPLNYQLHPELYYDTIPRVEWTVNKNNIISFSGNYHDIVSSYKTDDVYGAFPVSILTNKATDIVITYRSLDDKHATGSINVTVGKKVEEFNVNTIISQDGIEVINNNIIVMGTSSLALSSVIDDYQILNGRINFSITDLPNFINKSEYHDNISTKPTENRLSLSFDNINDVGRFTIKATPDDPINDQVYKEYIVNYGNAIRSLKFDLNDLIDGHSIVTTKDNVRYIDLIAGSSETNIHLITKAKLTINYPDYEPTNWKLAEWQLIGSSQYEVFSDDITLINNTIIKNNGIRYKNTNKEASRVQIKVSNPYYNLEDSITISTMGIRFKSDAPVVYVNDEYVYEDAIGAEDSINFNKLFDFVPSEDYISIQNIEVTNDLAELVDYTLEHNVFKITHVKSYDYDASKPIGINITATSYLITDPSKAVKIFMRVKLMDMNHMVNFGYTNGSIIEEMYIDNYDPDAENKYYSKNILLRMEGQDKHAIPDDYKITDVIFSSADTSIATYNNYDANPISFKDYKVSYELKKPGQTSITAKTSDNAYTSTSTFNVHGVMFTTKHMDAYTESVFSISDLIIKNGVASYGVIVYDIDTTLSTDTLSTIDHYTGEIEIGLGIGKLYIKAYYENYPKLYDYIIIDIEEMPTPECVDIDYTIIDPESQHYNEIVIRDETDVRYVTFKQKDANGEYLKPDVQLSEISVADIDDKLTYVIDPGSRPSKYPGMNLLVKDVPLIGDGNGIITVKSWDENVTKQIPIKYGNKILSASFPASVTENIDLANAPYTKQFRLNLELEYPDYKPSSNCKWTSSNPNIISVVSEGTLAKDPTASNKYTFYTTYTLHEPTIGFVTISAETEYGKYDFTIQVYDSDADVHRDMLQVHQVDMLYTIDDRDFRLNIDPPTDYTSITWTSENPNVATVSDLGFVTIVDVPDEDEFTYYDESGNPLEEVYLDFYIKVAVQTPMVKYVDKCLIHILGESKIKPTAKLIYNNSINAIARPEGEASARFMICYATPYYLKNNDSNETITFTCENDPDVPSPFSTDPFIHPWNFYIDGYANNIYEVKSKEAIMEIIDKEFEFEELPDDTLSGNYDYNEDNPNFDYDFSEIQDPDSGEDDGSFDFEEVTTEPIDPTVLFDIDFNETLIPLEPVEGYDFETINYNPDEPGPKDTPFDDEVLNRKYTVHFDPKYSYGVPPEDTKLDVHIVL